MKRYLSFISLLLILLHISCAGPEQKSNIDTILEKFHDANSDYVMVVAHRGDWRNAPENSLQAIKNCIEMGVDIVEIDVSLTKDSIPVLMHDGTIDRTTKGEGKIEDWTLDSLRTVYLRNGCGGVTPHKIPTLEEAMNLMKGKIMVNLDKSWAYMDKVYEVLKKTGTVDHAIFKGSRDVDYLNAQYGALMNKIIYMPIIRERTPDLEGHVDDFLTERKPEAFEILYKSDDSPMLNVIKTIKESGSRVWVNTLGASVCGGHDDNLAVDYPDEAWGWVIEHGANIIQTDRPELLIEYLREKGLHD